MTRQVYAQYRDTQVVRYEPGKKWWVEDNQGRERMSVEDAALTAVSLKRAGGWVLSGLPGAGQFDRIVGDNT